MTAKARPRITHGERTRLEILEAAEGLATREGLEGLSIAGLAEEVGMSKGGVYAHFGSKEALQLATIAAARERFKGEVVTPVLSRAPGLSRLRAAFELYFDYVGARLSDGGCFFTAAALEMADRAGPVRDQVREFWIFRRTLIARALEEARRKREIARSVDPEQVAFELVSLATGAIVELQLFRNEETLARVRAALDYRLSELAATKAK